ncbi:MAG: 16S rRNA (adenine(1518)-N(6)/adenine(1519)-N(6))-dimethyltransferase RsmA [Oscillospiraceae bacterium]|jgi:16S rRNA (adenine1518-N6/adenine1519-N6)-dimethyltransferase|nr:16S rRNA (adenine(1518)-N(6)/adenine(1519)-N(6))-dimethyltransferase RsmA [Oscillospiraceae bacterium]
MNQDLALLQKHGLRFSEKLGQNFLIDPAVCPRMAALCGATKTCGVLEVGPGAGVLTRELAHVAGKVVAIELDTRLRPVLREALAAHKNTEVLFGDVLQIDLAALLQTHFAGMPVHVCANLPYYITSPVLMRLLESRLPFVNITVMVQKEAAARLCAPMGTRACGAVTAAVAYYAAAQPLFQVSRDAFLPSPNVDSTVIQLTLRPAPPVAPPSEASFFRLIRAAFGQRRKTLPNALAAGLSAEKSQVVAALNCAGIPLAARAETLTLEDFARIAACWPGPL